MLIVIVLIQDRMKVTDEKEEEENQNKNLIVFGEVKNDDYIKNVNPDSKWKRSLQVY